MSRFTSKIPIDPNGYHWGNESGYPPEDGRLYEDSLVLHGKSEAGLRQEFRENGSLTTPGYDPFKREPALFRIFANLMPVTPERILDFAHQYGSIRTLSDVIEDTDAGSLSDWTTRIVRMNGVVRIADEYIRPSNSRCKVTPQTIVDFLEANRMGAGTLLAEPRVGAGGLELDIYAHDLLGVMDFQLIDAVCQRKNYRECDFCSKPYELSGGVNRSDKLFCSDTCRVKAYYRRKRLAQEMRAAGKTLREIVKATNSDLETVKRWVEKNKGGTDL